GWYISRQEQLEQGKSFSGVIRFCKKLTDDKGDFAGMYMLALDHRHIMDFIWHAPMDKESLVTTYKTGNYNYIIDDEGWIIAHPKNWDIRGLDKNGVPIEPLSENTPEWKFDAGLIPINLQKMDWRLHDIYTNEPMSSVINRVQRGETIITTMKSMGIYGESEGIIRTRAYAPIHYDSGPYDKHGIFGAVVIGTSLEEFLANTKILTQQIENINKFTKNRMIVIAAVILIGVIFFSFFVAKLMAKPMRKLNQVLNQIGDGNFDVPNINSSIQEIRELSHGVKNLASDLKDKEEKLNQNVKDLEIVNMKLAEAKKELDSYWKHEYETESDNVLEEKINFYEKEYTKLREIRREIYIGNSPVFLRMLRQIVPLSQMTIPTWIYGESGVGKSALARAMHLLSPRCDEPFHVFEASEFAAADPMIVLGKLFGYGPGHGIQGIDKNGQKGIVEECHRGTLLIDDVDALPLETQAQILRVVDGLPFHPAAGKSRNICSDIRFIFATNVDLEQRLRQGSFRKDLFRRMGGSVNKIEIPPLRDRKSDIPLLVNYFIGQVSNRFGVDFEITTGALKLLTGHDYYEGNIGELRMLIELACENARIEGDSTISEKHFPAIAKMEYQVIEKSNFSTGIFNRKECNELFVLRKNNFRMEASEHELGYRRGSRTLSHHLRGICLKALSRVDWNIDAASELIVGSLDGKTEEIIKTRIIGYLKNISDKRKLSQEASLYKNLPKEYHAVLKKSIIHFHEIAW
ncbi:MAG: sigma 54-interacting transcriptional regulator, partial [bacterium]